MFHEKAGFDKQPIGASREGIGSFAPPPASPSPDGSVLPLNHAWLMLYWPIVRELYGNQLSISLEEGI